MEPIFRNLFWMLFSGFMTLIVPWWLLPMTMGAGLVSMVLVLAEMRRNAKKPHRH